MWKTGIAEEDVIGKEGRMKWANFELLGGARPFLMVKRPVQRTQSGSPYGVGVHVEDRHSGGGCDRKRGGELTREARSASLSALERT